MDPKTLKNEEAKRWASEFMAFLEERRNTKPEPPEWDIYGSGPSNHEEIQAAIDEEAEKEHVYNIRYAEWESGSRAVADALRHRLQKHQGWKIKSLQGWFEAELRDLLDPNPLFSEREFSEEFIARRDAAEERIRRKRLLADSSNKG